MLRPRNSRLVSEIRIKDNDGLPTFPRHSIQTRNSKTLAMESHLPTPYASQSNTRNTFLRCLQRLKLALGNVQRYRDVSQYTCIKYRWNVQSIPAVFWTPIPFAIWPRIINAHTTIVRVIRNNQPATVNSIPEQITHLSSTPAMKLRPPNSFSCQTTC